MDAQKSADHGGRRLHAGEPQVESGARSVRAMCGELEPSVDYCIRVQRDRLNALVHQPLGQVGVVRRALTADAHVLAEPVRRLDRHRQQQLDRRIALVEGMCHQAGVAVEAQGELGKVVRADREAVEVLEELLGQDRVRRDLAHHDQLEVVRAAFETVLGEQFHHALGLFDVAHKGDHDLNVGQAELVPHLLHRRHFHLEAVAEAVGDVARGTPEAEHRVLFFRLVDLAAKQLAVLVRLEVGHAHDHGLRVEGRGDGGHALDQLLDEELLGRRVATRPAVDLVTQARRHLADVEDGLGVDADHVVDDELQARQADAGVGDLRELEGELRVAHVHHDLHRNLGQVAHVGGDDLELQLAAIDVTGVALGTRHRDRLALVQHVGGVAAADDRRDAELARDDRGVAGAAAAVGDDRARTLHHRLPVGVGHVGDEDVTGLHAVHLGSVADDAHHAGADLLADRAAVGERLAVLLEAVLLHHQAAVLALHGLGTRLQDVELAVDAVLAPLDVHRATIVLLDDHRVAGELEHVLVGEREAVAVGLGHIDRAHRLAGDGLVGEHHLDQLGAEVAADHRRLAQRQGGLVHVKLVRVHRALHHGFAEAVGGGDEHHLVKARLGVDREHHARCARIGAHHALHAGRQRDVGMGEVLVHAVSDRAVVVKRGEHFLHGVQDVLVAVDVEEGFLLAGEGRIREVFGGGRRAHREAAPAFGGDGLVGGLDLGLELGRERQLDDPVADLRAGLRQCIDVVDVERVERRVDAVGKAIVGEELAISIRRGRKAARDTHAGGQLADHLAERGVLATHDFDIGHAQFVEGDHVACHVWLPQMLERKQNTGSRSLRFFVLCCITGFAPIFTGPFPAEGPQGQQS
jgi:hypothetical protein